MLRFNRDPLDILADLRSDDNERVERGIRDAEAHELSRAGLIVDRHGIMGRSVKYSSLDR